MKKLLIILICCLIGQASQAQLSGLFFPGQQKKLRAAMTAQVAQLNIYYRVLKSGYHISQNGLGLADLLKDSTFSQHSAHFASLKNVAAAIAQNDQAAAIPQLSQQIAKRFSDELAFQQREKQLSIKELAYLKRVADHVNSLCKLDADELNQVIKPGELELTDQERLERIDKIYDRMKDKLAFAGSFTAKSHQLALSRKADQANRRKVRELYGLPHH